MCFKKNISEDGYISAFGTVLAVFLHTHKVVSCYVYYYLVDMVHFVL